MDGSGKISIALKVNGDSHEVIVAPRKLLSDVLREDLRCTGTHVGCEHGVCGACTVLLDGIAIKSCTVFAVQADGAEVTTIEGMEGEALHPLQEGFMEEHGLQCGFCTPGMIMSSKHLLDNNPTPTEDEIRWGISGNLCRCTGYQNIVKAVQYASNKLQETTTEGGE